MKATFEGTVGILVKAYFDDTLVKNNCYACAVGNIIAHSCGYQFIPCVDSSKKRIVWESANGLYWPLNPIERETITNWYELIVLNDKDSDTAEVRKEIESTGYTNAQLFEIERAFESQKDNFDGLMAVVDVLAEIHKVDLSTKESAKLQFVKP